jgi:hypothetical protein
MLIIALSINAKINTKFWDLSLGESSKEQVANVLQKKGYECLALNENVLGIEPQSGLDYGGTHWSAVVFSFYNNTLCEIKFFKYDVKDYSSMLYVLETLKDKLEEKYDDYYLFSDEESVVFDDGTTTLCVTLFNRKQIGLVYLNNSLNKLKKQAEDAEL